MYQRTISGIDRTNNHTEAAHRRLKRELDVVHPSIWKFIDGLRRVQKGRDVTYEQYVRGERGPVKRREYILADQRLLTIVNDYITVFLNLFKTRTIFGPVDTFADSR